MKSAHWLLAAAALLLATSTIPPAQAQDKGWYVGLGLNHSNDQDLDDEESDFKLFGGYRFNQHWRQVGRSSRIKANVHFSWFTSHGLYRPTVDTMRLGILCR